MGAREPYNILKSSFRPGANDESGIAQKLLHSLHSMLTPRNPTSYSWPHLTSIQKPFEQRRNSWFKYTQLTHCWWCVTAPFEPHTLQDGIPTTGISQCGAQVSAQLRLRGWLLPTCILPHPTSEPGFLTSCFCPWYVFRLYSCLSFWHGIHTVPGTCIQVLLSPANSGLSEAS